MAHNKDPKEIKSFDFGVELADSLVMPFITIRSLCGHKVEIYMGKQNDREKNNQINFECLSDERKRGRFCMNEICGSDQKAKNISCVR